jgi:methionyl-tRNA formyltransferase
VRAVNFHDGPLPRYAGLNAPVWALLNREPQYGVTWHEMTATADAGSILKQEHFDLADGETAFSLNTRCYEAGLRTFTALVDDISHDRVSPASQDLSLRTAFKRHDRPHHGSVVSWDVPAIDIRTLVLALDFGPYPNAFAAPRLLARTGVFLLTSVEVMDASPHSQPGTVMDAGPDQVVVATARSALAIRGVRRATGEALTMPQFVAEAGIRQGDRLPAIADTEVLDRASDAATRHGLIGCGASPRSRRSARRTSATVLLRPLRPLPDRASP